MACDLRFAHAYARLGLPEVDLGLILGAGGVQFISRMANPSVAKEVAMISDHLSAKRAHELNIVNRVYDEALDDVTREFAETLAFNRRSRCRPSRTAPTSRTILAYGRVTRTVVVVSNRSSMRKTIQEGARAVAEDDYVSEFEGR